MKKILLICTFILLISSCSKNDGETTKTELPTPKSQTTNTQSNTPISEKQDTCTEKKVSYTIKGSSMEPVLKDGGEIIVDENYYNCGNLPKNGDIVVYNSTSTSGPIIKQVRVMPGDECSIDKKSGNLSVNGKVLKNTAGKAYTFNDAEQGMLSLYINDGKMQEGAYFILGEAITGSLDSRVIGAVGCSKNSCSNFEGKYLEKKKK